MPGPARLESLSSWEEFQAWASTFEDPTRERWDEIWFRGQADAAQWKLETTLERRSKNIRNVEEYFDLISEIKPAIETFTGTNFEMPDLGEISQRCRANDMRFPSFLRGVMTYMAHLRHGGFPSPLLDWTSSPYVAAYFAFSRVPRDATDVAVYAYRESPHNSKSRASDDPHIISFGPLIKTHNRHFRQQSRYTMCVKFEDKAWAFSPHDEVYRMNNPRQDLLWKATIPVTERTKALRHFDKFNLNEFTLFASEEGLLEMLAMREIDMRQ